jgi:hypothetical protein
MRIDTGLQPIGAVEWGTHFCHFYKTADTLVETLVPFFKTGLEQGLRGSCELAFDRAGLACTIHAPVSGLLAATHGCYHG